MRSQKEIKADAYDRAQKEVCNRDCERYRLDTCPYTKNKNKSCYLFISAYDYWVSALIEHECTADHKIMTCDECDEYSVCPLLYH